MKPTILIHSSKTMRTPVATHSATTPSLMNKAVTLASYLRALSPEQIQQAMQVSPALAQQVQVMMAAWTDEPSQQALAIDSFAGDIYSGLQAHILSDSDRAYAQGTLRILSGLYGVLRPFDGVRPYRLEMGYRLPDEPYRNLYAYWGDDIARTLPKTGLIVNASAAEYTRTVLPYVDPDRVVAPRFLTRSPRTGQPVQVIVHTKIARGAFARWLIAGRVEAAAQLPEFRELGYQYDSALSTPQEPTFVCDEFGGIGLSVRLQK